MEYLEQFWSNIAQEPRYITYAGLVLNVIGISLIAFANLQRGPLGSRFSGKRAANGSGRQGPRPGQEPKSVVRRRWILTTFGVLFLVAGIGLHIAASEMQVSPS